MIRKFCNNCGRLVGNFRSGDLIPALCPVCEAGPSLWVVIFIVLGAFVLSAVLLASAVM